MCQTGAMVRRRPSFVISIEERSIQAYNKQGAGRDGSGTGPGVEFPPSPTLPCPKLGEQG